MKKSKGQTKLNVEPDAQGRLVARAHVLMVISTLLVASSFPIGAAITNGLDTLVLTFLRFTLAAILFAPIVIWQYGLNKPGIRDLARYATLSACLVGFFWAMFAALRETSALNTATIFTLTPVLTAIVAAVLLREKLNRAAKIALLVGLVGAVWVIFRGNLSLLLALELGRGDVIFLAGTCVMGFYGPLVKLLHRGEPMAQMTFWTLVTGAVWLLLLSAPRIADVEWTAVPIHVFAGIAYLAVFTTLVTFFVVQWSTAIIGPTKVMSYTYLNPALVLAIGLVMGGEAPPLATYAGLVLIIAATIVLQRAKSSITLATPART